MNSRLSRVDSHQSRATSRRSRTAANRTSSPAKPRRTIGAMTRTPIQSCRLAIRAWGPRS